MTNPQPSPSKAAITTHDPDQGPLEARQQQGEHRQQKEWIIDEELALLIESALIDVGPECKKCPHEGGGFNGAIVAHLRMRPHSTPAPGKQQQGEHRQLIILKCWTPSFQALKDGIKRFEFRKDDRPYAVGVTVKQEEWNPDTEYTGDYLYHDITFIIRGPAFGIPEGYCIFSTTEPRTTHSTPAPAFCIWTEDEDGIYHTECGSAHEFICEGPQENKHKYCPYCGRIIDPRGFPS